MTEDEMMTKICPDLLTDPEDNCCIGCSCMAFARCHKMEVGLNSKQYSCSRHRPQDFAK
jgi:hypothetical protein